MNKQYIIHPFSFAIYPILFLYYKNIEEITYSEIIIPIIFLLVLVVLINKIGSTISSNYHKVGILASLFLIFILFFGHIFNIVQYWHINSFYLGRIRFLLIFWIILFVSIAIYTSNVKTNLSKVTHFLNIISSVLVFYFLFLIILYKFYGNSNIKFVNYLTDNNSYSDQLSDVKSSRDFYYIILDEYANNNTLIDVYNFNNQSHIDYLTNKGFYVASRSRSNYAMTFLSLASSLNMNYINSMSQVIGNESKDRRLCDQMIQNNKIVDFFKSNGYKYIHLDSGWKSTSNNINADYNFFCKSNFGWLNEFEIVLIKTTILRFLVEHYNLFDISSRERTLFTFSKLSELNKIKGSKFVFAHIICPHEPYVFGANGETVSKNNEMEEKSLLEAEKQKYINQLIFVNKKIELLIEEILSQSNVPPVIILQADHGSGSFYGNLESVNHPSESNLKERMRIFNAYYLPGDSKKILYDSISPVNTFRLIFNIYFHSNFQLLKDQSYYSTYDRPFKFTDVTDIVKFSKTK